MTLTYKGNGAYTIGIPARDLSEGELQTIADNRGVTVADVTQELVDSGLYDRPTPPKKRKAAPKDEQPQTDNEDSD